MNVAGEAKFTSWLNLAGNYTFDDTRVLRAPNAFDPTETPGNRLLRRPPNSGSLTLNAAFRRFNATMGGYFSGVRTDSDFLGLGYTRNPGYARFDIAGQLSRGPRHFAVRAWVESFRQKVPGCARLSRAGARRGRWSEIYVQRPKLDARTRTDSLLLEWRKRQRYGAAHAASRARMYRHVAAHHGDRGIRTHQHAWRAARVAGTASEDRLGCRCMK